MAETGGVIACIREYYHRHPRSGFVLAGIPAFIFLVYCGMQLPQYPGGSVTAGWFYLGLPFIISMGFLWALLFYLLHYLISRRYAYVALWVVSLALAAWQWHRNTPEPFVRDQIFKFEAGTRFTVKSLSISDSFNGGLSGEGRIDLDPNDWEKFLHERPLQVKTDRDGKTVREDDWLTVTECGNDEYAFQWQQLKYIPDHP